MSIIVISILAILGWTSLFKQTFTTKEGFKYRFKLLAPLLRKIEDINITRIIRVFNFCENKKLQVEPCELREQNI